MFGQVILSMFNVVTLEGLASHDEEGW